MIKDILLKGLTVEQIEKVKSCNSAEELLQLAKDEGVELSDEQLSAVKGGACSDSEEQNDNSSRRKKEA